jgi:hypothetical protein
LRSSSLPLAGRRPTLLVLMLKLPLLSRIGNAAAVLFGSHGDVSAAARQTGCSRQTVYDHADKVQQAVEDAQPPGPSRAELLQQNQHLRQENRELWDWLEQTIDCPLGKQQQFTATACAMGLSLSQVLVLLAILLPANRLPSRATLGRWVNHSARRAGRALRLLDKACRPLILSLCLDEIFFHRKPVLMAVEPQSMAWVLGQRAADRSGDTWAVALAAWPNLQEVACDGGTGLARGLELAAAQRQQAAAQTPDGQAARPIHAQLDVFHTRRDGARVLRQQWGRAEAVWDEAVKVERAKERFDRQGTDKRQFNKKKVEKAWAKAVALFEQVCRQEKAWERACAALQVFRPDGQLNERGWAEAELAQAAKELPGSVWAKVRRQLLDERTLTFLDRLHEELAEAEPDRERRAALVKLWQWRREARKAEAQGSGNVVAAVGELLVAVVKARLGEKWQESYRRVSAALKGVVRASSAVECVNSVVRMHQSRHRNLSQELLDLKRLYWNCRDFVEGKRKDHCPYQLLGLKLPSYDPWVLLQMDPAELQKLLSSSGLTV